MQLRLVILARGHRSSRPRGQLNERTWGVALSALGARQRDEAAHSCSHHDGADSGTSPSSCCGGSTTRAGRRPSARHIGRTRAGGDRGGPRSFPSGRPMRAAGSATRPGRAEPLVPRRRLSDFVAPQTPSSSSKAGPAREQASWRSLSAGRHATTKRRRERRTGPVSVGRGRGGGAGFPSWRPFPPPRRLPRGWANLETAGGVPDQEGKPSAGQPAEQAEKRRRGQQRRRRRGTPSRCCVPQPN